MSFIALLNGVDRLSIKNVFAITSSFDIGKNISKYVQKTAILLS